MDPQTEQTLGLANDLIRFTVSVSDNTWSLEDLRAGVAWGNLGRGAPWVEIRTAPELGAPRTPLILSAAEAKDDGLCCSFADATGKMKLDLVFCLKGSALQVYAMPDPGLGYAAIDLFRSGLDATCAEDGEAFVPIRMGLLLPARGGDPFDLTWGTYDYEGVHLAMAGMFKSGAALLLDWGDPYTKVSVARTVEGDVNRIGMRVSLIKTALSVELRCLGKGDLTTLAEGYRERATELGYRVPWSEKLKDRPQGARLFGAANVKLWTALARRIDENLVETEAKVRWTFDEAASIAEHLKKDLELEDVLFHLGGWTRYGYDCRHPDIRPANPECGGNEALLDCVDRVKACGYLFCFHDNYQDMYRDSSSWDEAWLQKEADGTPTVGGFWLGGRAYYTCAREAVKLIQRPDNLPWVQEAFDPDLYFIDTTYAVGPQECYDPRHPLTKQQDIEWKIRLSDYTRDLLGMFGSECGREWAVPHADFFEGLASVSGDYFHRLQPADLGGSVVPFFDMVFHDCIALHGKYGYKPEEMAEQVIHHVAMGRTLYYHALGDHLYWQDPEELPEMPAAEGPMDAAMYTRAVGGWAEGMGRWDRFMKNTQEILGPLNKLTSQALIDRYEFLDEARTVRKTTFSNGVTTVVNGSAEDVTVTSAAGTQAVLPPYGFLVEAGTFTAFVATAWDGKSYDAPVLFTVTSLDDQPVATAKSFRIFHGFGESELLWQGKKHNVAREAVVE